MTRAETQILVQHYYDAFNNNDIPGMLDLLSDTVAHDVNQGVRRTGKTSFEQFCYQMDRCYSEKLDNVIIMVSEDGRHAAAEFLVKGIYKATDSGLPEAKGQTYQLPAGTFFTVENGKITRITTYYNLQSWIAQIKAG